MNNTEQLLEYVKKQNQRTRSVDLDVIVEPGDKISGNITYNDQIVLHRRIQNFRGLEEVVRACLVSRLVGELDYDPRYIELEKEYNIGRPKVNKARIDLILKDKDGRPFFFVEVKDPYAWENDQQYIEGQLFQLAKLEDPKAENLKYLVYYTVEVKEDGTLVDKCLMIDYQAYPTYEAWEEAGQPSIGTELTPRYGKPKKQPKIKGDDKYDLEKDFNGQELEGLRKNLHNVLWGGGGTDDNEIFSSLVNIILAKIQDEEHTEAGKEYKFQVYAYGKDGTELETAESVYERVNALYRDALKQRMFLSSDEVKEANIIDRRKFGLNKLLYTVQQLEKYSFVEGRKSLSGRDILGEFFEGIIREGFKQSKGQFFTPQNIVKFIIYGLKVDDMAIDLMNNESRLPYIIDPSAGSGTFLLDALQIVTSTVKRERFGDLKNSNDVQDRYSELFMPDSRENKWAREYLYGMDINFNLGTATKVNMILHGDGSTNIFVGERRGDGLLPFRNYIKETGTNVLNKSEVDPLYGGKPVNSQFDVIIANPPFSVDLDKETKRFVLNDFLFGDKKNSENLFIERYYQLLKPKGRMGIVLPESIFDTTENKYIRLFLFKYFTVKAVVSLPQVTFEPYTSTKTSIVFAQKKTSKEISEYAELWDKYASEFTKLKTKVENYIHVLVEGKEPSRYPSIAADDARTMLEVTQRYLKDYISEEDSKLATKELLIKYKQAIVDLGKESNESTNWSNEWWVFGEVAEKLDYPISMTEVEHVGYKRTKRSTRLMPNDLFIQDSSGKVDLDESHDKVLNNLRREIEW